MSFLKEVRSSLNPKRPASRTFSWARKRLARYGMTNVSAGLTTRVLLQTLSMNAPSAQAARRYRQICVCQQQRVVRQPSDHVCSHDHHAPAVGAGMTGLRGVSLTAHHHARGGGEPLSQDHGETYLSRPKPQGRAWVALPFSSRSRCLRVRPQDGDSYPPTPYLSPLVISEAF